MDPLSVAASILAVIGAVERLRSVAGDLSLSMRASEEIDTVLNEVQSLGAVLHTMSRRIILCLPVFQDELLEPLENCKKIVADIEEVIGSLFDESGFVCKTALQQQVFRLRWAKKRKRIEALAQRLEKAKGTLALHLLVAYFPRSEETRQPENPDSECRSHHRGAKQHGRSISEASATKSVITPSMRTRGEKMHGEISVCAPSILYKNLKTWDTSLGSFIVCHSSFAPCTQSACGICQKRETTSASATWYPPRWLSVVGFRVAATTSRRISASLQFPQVIPPDAELVKSIRSGDTQRIRELLHSGQASIADVILPYGLTPLHLAVVYEHHEVCELLMSAGALLYAPRHTWTPKDMLDYFISHSLHGSTMSAGEIVQDTLRMSSTSLGMTSILHCLSRSESAFGQFPRLHKSVLGLTLEPVDDVAPTSRLCANEYDGTIRTALHWATHLQDRKTMGKLLLCGADPNMGDGDGTTPLHIAASIGFCEGMDLLIASGADIESRDRNGSTPLYRAVIGASNDAIRLLLEAGADAQAHNFMGETPMSYATYAEKGEAVYILRNGGCPLENVDDWGYTTLLDNVLMDCHSLLSAFPFSEVSNSVRIKDGKTLLHIAAANSDLRTIEILQNARLTGVEVYVKDNAGFTAMDYLRKRRDFEEVFEAFCALTVSIRPTECDPKMEDVFFDALEFLVQGVASEDF